MSPQFAAQIATKDQIKLLKKKLEMLKEAVRKEQKQKNKQQQSIIELKNKCRHYEGELRKKEDKNQILLNEIRQLKDTLLMQRNQKQKYLDTINEYKLKQKKQVGQNGSNGVVKAMGGYLGSFFK